MPRSMCSSIPKPKLPNIIIKIRRRRVGRLTVVGEVPSSELEFLDLEAAFKQLLGLLAADGDVHSNLLVSLDGESPDGVARAGLDGLLVGEVLEHLRGFGKLVTGFTSAEVDHELLHPDLPHHVVLLRCLILSHIFFLSLLTY